MNKEHLKFLVDEIGKSANAPEKPKPIELKSNQSKSNAKITETRTGYNVSLTKLSHSQKKRFRELMQELLDS